MIERRLVFFSSFSNNEKNRNSSDASNPAYNKDQVLVQEGVIHREGAHVAVGSLLEAFSAMVA